MNKLHYLLFALLITGLSVSGQTVKNNQTTDKFIRVGDTTINLNDVDLEKGMKIKGKQFVKKGDDDSPMNYRTRFEVFVSPERDFYAVVSDTIKWYEGSYYSEAKSVLHYFNGNNKMLFNKSYMVYLGVFVYYISSGGETLVVSVTGEDRESLYILKSNGDIIKAYDGERDVYIGPLHKHSFIREDYKREGPNIYDLIDKSGNIEEVVFPDGHLTGIKFSPHENYYLVLLDKHGLLYDINNNFIWKHDYNINFWFDEKSYLIHNYQNNSIELRDLFNHKLIYSIDSVKYHDNYFPIYRWNIIDSNFYAIGRNDSIYIYNFYNADGAIIQTETVPVIKRTKPYKVRKQGDRFIIEPRKRNQ